MENNAREWGHPTVLCLLSKKGYLRSTGAPAQILGQSPTHRLCFMVDMDIIQINMVEGEGFCVLLNYIEPASIFPSGATITNCTDKQYKEKKDGPKDSWTSWL